MNDAVRVNIHLGKIVVSFKLRLLQVIGFESIGVDDDGCLRFSIAILCFQSSRIHGNEHVALVARRIDPSFSDMYLKTADTSQ